MIMTSQNNGHLVVVTGLSGSGKSLALKTLEDIGYLTIDNLPVVLLPKFLAIRKESGGFIRLAVGMDAREVELTNHFEKIFEEAKNMGYELTVLFIEATQEVLVKRYSETRRPHHLALNGGIVQAIEAEREYLAPVRLASGEIIDTSNLKAGDLKEIIINRFSPEGTRRKMAVEILSFGFKNGLPPEADLMVDVRFLPNPFYLDDLRKLGGLDKPVSDYVLGAPETHGFLERFMSLLTYLLPLYQKEGKSYLTIAVGCTGGQHRSVAIACFLQHSLQTMGQRGETFDGTIELRHRDLPQALTDAS